jgi:hypothetical protein
MPWFTMYATVAVAVLSVVGACFAKGLKHDPWRLVAIIAAAALWPVLVVGVIQFGMIDLYARHLRRGAVTQAPRSAPEPDPVTAQMVLVDSFVRMAQRSGAKHPA